MCAWSVRLVYDEPVENFDDNVNGADSHRLMVMLGRCRFCHHGRLYPTATAAATTAVAVESSPSFVPHACSGAGPEQHPLV